MRMRHRDTLQTGVRGRNPNGVGIGLLGIMLVVGSYLTVPRADMFGLSLFLGDRIGCTIHEGDSQ